MRNPQPPTKTNPQPLDIALFDLGASLEIKLPWLSNTYGKVEKLVRTKSDSNRDKKVSNAKKYPAIFVGGKKGEDYLSMLPDRHLGNYMYCDVTREEIEHKPRQSRDGVVELDLVFHWNYKKVYPADHLTRSIENVKADIFNAIDRCVWSNFDLRVLEFEESAENIYKGYSHNEIDRQMLMRPYGGVKVKAILRYTNSC